MSGRRQRRSRDANQGGCNYRTNAFSRKCVNENIFINCVGFSFARRPRCLTLGEGRFGTSPSKSENQIRRHPYRRDARALAQAVSGTPRSGLCFRSCVVAHPREFTFCVKRKSCALCNSWACHLEFGLSNQRSVSCPAPEQPAPNPKAFENDYNSRFRWPQFYC